MNENISYKLGRIVSKYWWILIILCLTYFLWPEDYFKNCLNDFHATYKSKFYTPENDTALAKCSYVQKEHPGIFNELKGQIFSKSKLFRR